MKEITANRIRDLRLEKNMTQEEFANFIGISYGCYKEYESVKKKQYTEEVMLKIAEAHNVSLDYIHGRTNTRVLK